MVTEGHEDAGDKVGNVVGMGADKCAESQHARVALQQSTSQAGLVVNHALLLVPQLGLGAFAESGLGQEMHFLTDSQLALHVFLASWHQLREGCKSICWAKYCT